jgi:hypothetical protein
MDVTTTEVQHNPGSLAGMTLDEGIPLKKVTLIERISESPSRKNCDAVATFYICCSKDAESSTHW